MDIQVREVSKDTWKDAYEAIPNADDIKELADMWNKDSLTAALWLKKSMNINGIMAEILTFGNGNNNIKISIDGNETDTKIFSVLLLGEAVIDLAHTTEIMYTKEFIEKLEEDNPDLDVVCGMSSGWYDEDGHPIDVTLDYLKEYKY